MMEHEDASRAGTHSDGSQASTQRDSRAQVLSSTSDASTSEERPNGTSRIARILPLQKMNNVVENDIISFMLPEEAILDFSTLRLWFIATINGATANNTSLPCDVETMIKHLWITVDGVEIQRIQNYNQLFRSLRDCEQTYDDNRKRILTSWSGYVPNGLNVGAYNFSNTPLCMTKWYGFLGCNELIKTRLTG